MLGLTGVLIALIVLTIVLAGVFLVRPSITAGTTGKILAFIGLCVLPALCIGTGMSSHMERSQQTSYCISCHSMESHGKSLYVLDPSYIPAQHFQNHLVPPDQACYTCHTDYTMYGPLKDKLKGLRYVYMEYVSTPPQIIHLDGKYSNLQCLHCHEGSRNFEENLARMPPLASLKSDQISCISSGCHDTIHNASEVDHLQMWTEGAAATPVASAAAPAAAGAAATAGPSKAPAGSSAGDGTAARGKTIFASSGCSGCHGGAGIGGSGPALTHTSSQYPPAQLTAVLKAPTAGMKAAGMVPLTLNAADMTALVSYMDSLGGASAASAPGSSSAAPANAKPAAAGAPTKAPAGGSAVDATAAQGKGIYDSNGCSGCHGVAGVGGSGPALTHTSSQYPPAQLTAVLKAPTAAMKAAGMVPLTLNAADMTALVSYVDGLGGASAPSAAAAPTAVGGPVKAPAASPVDKATVAQGKAIYDSNGCSGCHGVAGVGGSGPALTHTSSQYPPAQLTAVLKAPTAGMKAAGMVPLTLNAADMKALVSYVDNLGGASAPAAATPAAPAKPAKKKGALGWLFSP